MKEHYSWLTKSNKSLLVGVICISLILLILMLFARKSPIQITQYTSEPTIQTLEKLSHLVSLKVHIADVLEANSKAGMKYVKGAWLIKGDALLGVDMTKASIALIDHTNRYAIIMLAPPQVMSARVDHDKTKTYNVTSGTFTPGDFESSVRDNAMREAQQLITYAANHEDNVSLARDRCELLLKGFYALTDWTIDVKWSDRMIIPENVIKMRQNAEPAPPAGRGEAPRP